MATGEKSSTEAFSMFVGGEPTNSVGGETFDATNPATGESLGEVPKGTRENAQRAIDAAREVQPELEAMTDFERAELCHEMADAIEANHDHLAEWLTADQGKPLQEARTEVELCAKEFRNAAEDVKRAETEVIPSEDPNKRIYTIRKPHGVLGVITPWNYPLNIPAEYLAPGLAVGNAVVWVPAPSTSVVAVKLLEAFADADVSLPDGALNLVTGEGPVVGDEVVINDGTDAIGFTGSPETGEEIASKAGTKPTLLELGGNGPVIVLDDADIDAAVEATSFGCFSNAGQICSASERVLVHEDVREEFTERMAERAREFRLGDPTESETDIGPLNNEGVAEKMDRHIDEARENGAAVLTGGGRADDLPTDLYYEPTVLSGVTTEMAVNWEESFGPIAPIIGFDTYDEAVEIANEIELGLTSSVFTSNLELAEYFADNVETGIVNINDNSAYWEIHTPFGGYTGKRSGRGRIGGKHSIEELSQLKTITVDHGNARSPLDTE
ncbi:aldehyde dehydrogenase family protein [Halorussus limi]|uniref:Aldehyde dehydrogenase family protein n=1 Tax=Halorussus limi TaxID=2938695 RepID=A0A8U0HYM9_9EURY|nr:aldehyde dehydrogenase family protein [Halorussus limi]UPV75893.1 aldehyde dehydrogenase family protein [Halorussus limi]